MLIRPIGTVFLCAFGALDIEKLILCHRFSGGSGKRECVTAVTKDTAGCDKTMIPSWLQQISCVTTTTKDVVVL